MLLEQAFMNVAGKNEAPYTRLSSSAAPVYCLQGELLIAASKHADQKGQIITPNLQTCIAVILHAKTETIAVTTIGHFDLVETNAYLSYYRGYSTFDKLAHEINNQAIKNMYDAVKTMCLDATIKATILGGQRDYFRWCVPDSVACKIECADYLRNTLHIDDIQFGEELNTCCHDYPTTNIEALNCTVNVDNGQYLVSVCDRKYMRDLFAILTPEQRNWVMKRNKIPRTLSTIDQFRYRPKYVYFC